MFFQGVLKPLCILTIRWMPVRDGIVAVITFCRYGEVSLNFDSGKRYRYVVIPGMIKVHPCYLYYAYRAA